MHQEEGLAAGLGGGVGIGFSQHAGQVIVADGTPSEVFSDVHLLEENNLDVPEICKVFSILDCYGCTCEEQPLTLPGAARMLNGLIESNGGTVTLGRTDATDAYVADLVRRFGLSRE